MTPLHDPRGPLTAWARRPAAHAPRVTRPADGPGLFEVTDPGPGTAPGTSPTCGGSPEAAARPVRC